MPEPSEIAAGIARIRRTRGAFLVLLGVALVTIWFASDLVHAGLAWLPLAAFAVASVSWLLFAYHPCPQCGQLFFVRGDLSRNPFLLRLGVRPFSQACRNCGLPLARWPVQLKPDPLDRAMRVLITYEHDASAEIAEPTADCLWAIDTPANRAAAESRWRDPSYKGFEVTVFNPQSLSGLLPTVLEHHPDCDILEVREAEAESDVWQELGRHHFIPLRQSRGVLRAGRRSGAV